MSKRVKTEKTMPNGKKKMCVQCLYNKPCTCKGKNKKY